MPVLEFSSHRQPMGLAGRVSSLEVAARAALEAALGRALTDTEWSRARHRLLEVAHIVRAFQLRACLPEAEDGGLEQQPKAA
jgi:hypothetical protein